MEAVIKAYLGSNPQAFKVDPDDYGIRKPRESTSLHDLGIACEMLEHVLCTGIDFAASGHRNDQAVNACIALHVMGYDPEEWLGNFLDDHGWRLASRYACFAFMNHVRRIAPYCEKWGPEKEEHEALNFAI